MVRMRRIDLVALACLALAACEVSGENWVAAIGGFEATLPSVVNGEASAPACDSLDGAMCARDGSLLCAGTLEGTNSPAMCPAGGL